MWRINLNGHSQGFMRLIQIGIGGCFRRKHMVYLIGGMYHGVLEVISMWFAFLPNYWELRIILKLFFDFISTHGTIDLPLEGDSFTWSSTRKQVDLELTTFCSQRIERFSSQMFEGCPTLCLTTFQFSKIVVVSKEAIILLDLKTCGSRLKVLWRK